MALITEVGSATFLATDTTGAKAVTLSNFTGEVPKAAIYFLRLQQGNDHGLGLGLSTHRQASAPTDESTISGLNSEDAQGSSDNNNVMQLNRFWQVNTTAGVNVAADWGASASSYGFDTNHIDWWISTANNTVDVEINYLILGGSSLQAHVVQWTGPAAADSAFSITGAGFTPSAAITIFNANATGALSANAYDVGMAFWDGTNTRVFEARARNARPTMEAWHESSNDALRCISAAGSLRTLATFNSFNSDGAELNFTTSSSRAFTTLFLGGVDFKCGNELSPTSASTVSINVGFAPSAVLLASHGGSHTAAAQDHAQLAVGASDGTNDRAIVINDEDAQSTSDVDSSESTTKSLQIMGHSTGTVVDEADVSFDGNDVDVNFTTADSTQRAFFYLAIGEAAPADPLPVSAQLNQAVNRAGTY